MNAPVKLDELEVGYDIPALPGMDQADIQTPCLVLDLDALERNIKKMGDWAKEHGMRHRVHGKMHKSVDVALLQEKLGGAVGVCCQKVSEAEVFARGGIRDVLVSNQVRDPAKIDRLARMPKLGARTIVCVDEIENAPGRRRSRRGRQRRPRAKAYGCTMSSPTCRPRPRSTAPRSSAWLRSIAVPGAAA